MDSKKYREKVKSLGYTTRMRKYSDFKAIYYYKDGKQVPTNVMTKQDAEAHAALHNLRQSYKGTIKDGLWSVVI